MFAIRQIELLEYSEWKSFMFVTQLKKNENSTFLYLPFVCQFLAIYYLI